MYADLANLAANPAIPREEFYHYLRALMRAGFGRRLMFGSGLESTEWANGIGSVVEPIAAAPFLSPSDRANIFCGNAERFLRSKAGYGTRRERAYRTGSSGAKSNGSGEGRRG